MQRLKVATNTKYMAEWTPGDDVNWRSHVEATRTRYVTRYLDFAQRNTKTYSKLETELPNLMNAVQQASAQQQYDSILKMAQWLWSDGGQFLDLQGHFREGTQLLTQAVDAARHLGGKGEEHRFLGQLARAAIALRDWPTSAQHLGEALAIARESGDRQGEANHLGTLGQVQLERNQRSKAEASFRAALEIAQEIGDRQLEGRLWASLGLLKFENFNRAGLIEAIENFEKGIAIARETGDRRGEASHLGSLGRAYELIGLGSLALPEFVSGPYPHDNEVRHRQYSEDLQRANQESFFYAYESYEKALWIAKEIRDRQMQARFRADKSRTASEGKLPLWHASEEIDKNMWYRNHPWLLLDPSPPFLRRH